MHVLTGTGVQADVGHPPLSPSDPTNHPFPRWIESLPLNHWIIQIEQLPGKNRAVLAACRAVNKSPSKKGLNQWSSNDNVCETR